MTTVESANTPLQFAYLAAKHCKPDAAQVSSLRHVASLYVKSGASEDMECGLVLVQEAHQMAYGLHHERMCDFDREFPTFAVDYTALGRPDIALQVLDESILTAKDLPPTERLEMLIGTAEVCYDLREHSRCLEMLDSIAPYLRGRKRFRRFADTNIRHLVSLYLKLGRESEAIAVAEKLNPGMKSYAYTELAFHGQPSGQCREEFLDVAFQVAADEQDDYPLLNIADQLAINGQLGRAQEVLSRIEVPYIKFEGLRNIAVHLIDAGLQADTMAVIDELIAYTSTHYECYPAGINHLVTLLANDHMDVARALIALVQIDTNKDTREEYLKLELSEAIRVQDGLLQLLHLAELVSLVSIPEAEVIIDEILYCRLSEFDTGIDLSSCENNPQISILYDIAILIADNKLRWDDSRIQKFRDYLNGTL